MGWLAWRTCCWIGSSGCLCLIPLWTVGEHLHRGDLVATVNLLDVGCMESSGPHLPLHHLLNVLDEIFLMVHSKYLFETVLQHSIF